MSDFSIPTLPVTAGCSGAFGHGYNSFDAADGCSHVLNADVVKCGQDAILSKLEASEARDNLRATLESQREAQKSISEVRREIEATNALQRLVQCEVQGHVTREAQATRDLINLDIRRRDDQHIRELELKLALCSKCGCGSGSSGNGTTNGD